MQYWVGEKVKCNDKQINKNETRLKIESRPKCMKFIKNALHMKSKKKKKY